MCVHIFALSCLGQVVRLNPCVKRASVVPLLWGRGGQVLLLRDGGGLCERLYVCLWFCVMCYVLIFL